MRPQPVVSHADSVTTGTDRILNGLSLLTLIMTIPQVWTIWRERQTAGVSLVSWSAYLLSAIVWFRYGLKKRDRHIYLPCIGWIVLDGAVVIGTFMFG